MSNDTNEADGVEAAKRAEKIGAAIASVCAYSADAMAADMTPNERAASTLRRAVQEIERGNIPIETAVLLFNHPQASFVLTTGSPMSVMDVAGLFAHRLVTLCGYNPHTVAALVARAIAHAELSGESATIGTLDPPPDGADAPTRH